MHVVVDSNACHQVTNDVSGECYGVARGYMTMIKRFSMNCPLNILNSYDPVGKIILPSDVCKTQEYTLL